MGFPGSRSTRSSRAVNPPAAPAEPPTPDWPTQATDSIIRLVDNVRDRTTGPALTAARFIVYGTVIFFLATPLAVLLLVGAMRSMEALLVQLGLTDPIWLVDLTFGGIFLGSGLLLWSKAKRPASATT